MKLTEVIRKVAPSVVAFGTRVIQATSSTPPGFPKLVGTGFVVDERGLIVTNQHVVDALAKNRELPPFVMIFPEPKLVDAGVSASLVIRNIVGVCSISEFGSLGPYFGEGKPDIAFVEVDIKGLRPLEISGGANMLEVGVEVVTLGFPLGEAPMTPYDPQKPSQFCALARRGIISSVLPCPCPEPHGFSIDVLSENGASGSPIFRTDDPRAIGILHQSFEHAPITYGVPGHFIKLALDKIVATWQPKFPNVPTLAQVVEQIKPGAPSGFNWTVLSMPDDQKRVG